MSIEANFNKLLVFKKFNNYFNRKIIGGELLKDYVFSADLSLSGETSEFSKTFTKNEILDFVRLTSFYFKTDISDIPVGVEIDNIDYEIENDGGVIGDALPEYEVDVRKLNVKVRTTAFDEAAIPDNFTLTVKITFINHSFQIRKDINFNPNEGVLSEIILNNLSFESDYILVLDSNNLIISRWFVLETIRTRSGQAKLTLKRDVIYDNLEQLKQSPIFVQKGMLKEEDPFIVNNEGMIVNQIRNIKQPLMDLSKNAWIIIYIAKNTGTENVYGEMGLNCDISANRNPTIDENYDIIAIPYYDMRTSGGSKHFGQYAKMVAKAIGMKLDAQCYDIQLLPYCPIVKFFDDDNEMHLPISDANKVTYDTISQAPSSASGQAETFLEEKDFPEASYNDLTQKWETSQQFTFFDMGIRNADIATAITYSQIFGTSISGATLSFDNANKVINISLEFNTKPGEYALDVVCDYDPGLLNEQIGFLFYCPKATFENKILFDWTKSSDENLKELSNLEMWRFVSPNYQGSFEMNIGKNGGNIRNVIAYCTYKPYTPFIKVAPEFEFLYAQRVKDQIGLICSGDFSLPRTTDAWETFQLNNKNYQNIFNREIQNMDFNYGIELRNQIISGTVGVGTAALTGAAAGAVVGSIVPGIGTAVGAAVGAIGGAITSGTGMVVDTITMAQKYKENKDLTIDKFNYQLGNIKALPYTLTKVGSFDVISAIWPFIEQYKCTYEEKVAFKEKINYESMTVMRIDKLINFYNKFDKLCYFKGELIRNTEIAGDYHILQAIYAELLKGVYI